MMSAPDRVDIDLPNTEDAKMVSVKSTENLRHMLSPSHQQEHKQRSQQRQQVLKQLLGQPSHSNNNGNNTNHHHAAANTDQHRAAIQAAQHQGLGVDMTFGGGNAPSTRSHTAPPITNLSCQGYTQQQQQQHNPDNAVPPEYTAWTIGSTEALQRYMMAVQNQSSAVQYGAVMASPYNSAILAKGSSGMAWRGPSPDLASDTSPVPMSAASSVSGTSPPPPPVPAPSMPPTLGGLSENMGMEGFKDSKQQEQNFEKPQRSNSLPPQYFSTPPPPSSLVPEPITPASSAASTVPHNQANQVVTCQYDKSLQQLYHNRLLSTPASSVESILSSSCESLNFDIAEMWLRTGPKTHQLTNSHVRATALDESVRKQLVDVYYGERSAERTHRLSPALCKRAKEAGDVVWVTAHTVHGAEALKCSISDVRTAVAVPVCHGGSGVNVTIIYFSIRRAIMKPQAVEFLVHMSLATVAAAVNLLADEVMVDEAPHLLFEESVGEDRPLGYSVSRDGSHRILSITGAQLNLQWDSLRNVEYLTDGGNNWIHTAVLNGKSVVVKTLKPECQDVALAINEIEGELEVHSRLDHPNIVKLIGAGFTPRGVRFVVMERLDGGTLTQLLGYDNRIRDRRRRFWTKRKLSYMDVLKYARSLAEALAYLHGRAIPNVMVLHRDLKPDNIVSDEVYEMSGETGSLRYMAPEVADCQPYNQKADVYSFGKLLSVDHSL
ncbi:hypothetical protein ACHAXA_008554 [Cyclostephanos tholiformis]|uniref:Protein kinase domain-containing protein n=1 Tax=Cyclostephanos tholiformis TaxID=382380 RepID=A0ABD3RC04_9STRA